jgi:nitrile hydratase subunit beta
VNGIHDMGGMHGMGPVAPEENEPAFHKPWEGRVFALTRGLGAWGKWNIDEGRHVLEQIPPAEYLRMSYYEKWLVRIPQLTVRHGLLTQAELEDGKPEPGSEKLTPVLTPERVAASFTRSGNYMRPEAEAIARFQPGDEIRARNVHPTGHTRLPRYVRGKRGRIARQHGIFVFPDANAHHEGEQPQHLYSVRFGAQELWGDAASPKDSVHLDLWESYIEHA